MKRSFCQHSLLPVPLSTWPTKQYRVPKEDVKAKHLRRFDSWSWATLSTSAQFSHLSRSVDGSLMLVEKVMDGSNRGGQTYADKFPDKIRAFVCGLVVRTLWKSLTRTTV